ncbi:carboxypeptidase S1 A-like protein [Naviculisporaceae sp. PSN 640]
MRVATLTLAAASFLASPVFAQDNFVSAPKDLKTVLSKKFPGASITYKSTNNLCETTPGVNSYSGYVHLPSALLEDVPIHGYNVSLFFWYFQARKNPSTASVAIYIAGGPGESSFDDTSGFPCTINPDSNSTSLNEDFSWNANTNMLYIDQPIGTGFSYSVLVNGVKDLVAFNPDREFSQEDPGSFTQTNITVTPATVSNPSAQFVVNTTASAARTLWHFAQVWFQEFPEYVSKTTNSEISIWANSYGGFYAPATFAHFERQNDLISSGNLSTSTYKTLNLQTIGLTNACMDAKIQLPFYPSYAFNNTYGIEAISEEVYQSAMTNFTASGGCRDLIDTCRAAGIQGDPNQTGGNATVNQLCALATDYCFANVQGVLERHSPLNPFDIGLTLPTQYPILYGLAFYNQPWVQEALGVPVNHTMSSTIVRNTFFRTGDPALLTYKDLEFLLKKGKNIAMVYGDRDYRCAWTGAEAISLVLEHESEEETERFRQAGYANISIGGTSSGKGVVRQAGRLSFSRVFDAGHNVAAYQPDVVFNIFERAMSGKDVATGEKNIVAEGDEDESGEYETEGPVDSFVIKNQVPEKPMVEPACLVYQPATTCTENQILALMNRTARVEDYIVTEPSAGGDGEGDGNETGGGEDNGDGQQGGGEAQPGEDKKDAGIGKFEIMAGRYYVGFLCVGLALFAPGVLFL